MNVAIALPRPAPDLTFDEPKPRKAKAYFGRPGFRLSDADVAVSQY